VPREGRAETHDRTGRETMAIKPRYVALIIGILLVILIAVALRRLT
jgi:hypothetical protein